MISKHVSYEEGVYSNTALRRGIDNTPEDDQLHFMELIAEKVFEPLREWVSEKNRNKCLKAYKENKKTKYKII